MKTRIKPLLVSASAAIAVALLAFSFTFGSSRSARAEDGEPLAVARQDMVLVSAKDLEGLEQRVSQLEGIIASLTESSQRIKTHQLCISDDSGAETCITKAQLDALLATQARTAEAAKTAAVTDHEGTPSAKGQTAAAPPNNSEPPAAAVSTSKSEPSAPASIDEISPAEPESTGSISTPTASPTALAAQPSASPDSEAVETDEVQGSITPTAPPTPLAAQPSASPDSEAVETDDLDLD
jgi:hypothetical protein